MPMDWGLARDYAARDVHKGETPVTEAEWLAATDPGPMLDHLIGAGIAGKRKRRLFAVACCRRIWDLLLDVQLQPIVEMTELFADSGVPLQRLQQAKQATDGSSKVGMAFGLARHAVVLATSPRCPSLVWVAKACRDAVAARAASECRRRGMRAQERQATADKATRDERLCQVDLIRDVYGNPFLPALLLAAGIPVRNEGRVRDVATVIYDARVFDRLPILADALEDAACTDAELLGHLRSPGPHVRGCWALDLVLGKS
jgi:hypothetical protein